MLFRVGFRIIPKLTLPGISYHFTIFQIKVSYEDSSNIGELANQILKQIPFLGLNFGFGLSATARSTLFFTFILAGSYDFRESLMVERALCLNCRQGLVY